jgi:translocator protein
MVQSKRGAQQTFTAMKLNPPNTDMANHPTAKAHWGLYLLIVAFTILAAAAGSVASIAVPEFYQALKRPSWAPPPWLFGPAWTLLYTLMAVAACLVLKAKGWAASRPALALYFFQLVLNGLWTWLFFRWRLGGLATLEIGILWISIGLTVAAFWKIRPLAGALLLPYWAWVSFASALSLSIWQLNPGVL